MKLLLALSMMFLLVACSSEVGQPIANPGEAGPASTPQRVVSIPTETERINLWFDERFEERMSRSPFWLTRLGRKEKYDQIDDLSEAAEERELAWHAETVSDMKSQFDYSLLSDDAQISYDIWLYQYEIAKRMAEFRRHQYIFTQMYGAQTEAPLFLINYHRVDDVSDMRAYIARIAGISRALDQLLHRAKVAVEDGIRPPRFAYEMALEEAIAQLSGNPFSSERPSDAPLWADAKAKLGVLQQAGKVDATQAASLTEAVREALLESFQPSYLRLISWLEAEIEDSALDAHGVGALPNGEAYYDASLHFRTTLPLTAEELHQTGLEEVSRLRDEMDSIRELVGFEGSLEQFFQYVKTDQQFYYPNDDEGRLSYIEDVKKKLDWIDQKLPEHFGLLPKAGLLVKRVEPYRERAGDAFYDSGTPDGSRPGVYYVGLSDMRDMPIPQLEALAYHEGNPGHHMETAIGQELTEVPTFRTQAFFNSHTEGWALYAEYLAKEMGAYQDPYSDFGRLEMEMMRAIRLVVDTGIHSLGWTEQQAISYFESNSSNNYEYIKSEVRRYFVWPGQATSYKVGMLKIQSLRREAEEKLGKKFDIRRFHDAVLTLGPVPLTLMERGVVAWIEESQVQ